MARRRNRQEFQTIRSEGGLLPPDLLRRLIDPRSKLPGVRPEDYALTAHEQPAAAPYTAELRSPTCCCRK